MDLLKELEAKKEKLRLLKERRQLIHEGNYHATNTLSDLDSVSIDDKPEYMGKIRTNFSKLTMVDDAVQTENFSTELHLPALLPPINDGSRHCTEDGAKVRTFDHGVQADCIKEYNNNDNDNNNNGDDIFVVTKENSFDSSNPDSVSSDIENKSLQPFKEDEILKENKSKLFEMKPLVIDNGFLVEHGINNGGTNTSNNKYESFASRWYSRGENVKEEIEINVRQEIGETQNDKAIKRINKIYHLHTCEIKDNQDKDSTIICKSVDFDVNRHITLVALSVVPNISNKPNIDMDTVIPKSFVYVIDTFTDKLIDKVEFLGQTITRSKILRNSIETHNIISMILLSQRGKIILYELQRTMQEDNVNWNRNICIKNYHLSCDYLKAIWETKFKLIVGDSKGHISILNALDLSYDTTMFVKYDNDNNNKNSKFGNETSLSPSKIKVVPPSNSILYSTVSEEISKETQLFIDEYLSKLTIFNELNITSIVGSPFNNECIFLGTEDGGIYKIFLNVTNDREILKKDKNNDKDNNNNKITIDIENNGFLPKIPNERLLSVETNLNEKILFHNGYVTSLSMNTQGLLLSSSIDWTIKLWDTKDNQILDSINLQKPILSVEWIDMNKNNNNNNNTREMKHNLLNKKYVCYAMTWDTIYIIQWFIVREVDPDKEKRDRQHFKRGEQCKILNKVHIDQKYLRYNQFTSSKLVVDTIDDENNVINTLLLLAGDIVSIDYVQMIISPY